MRRPKYRAWHKQERKMYPVLTLIMGFEGKELVRVQGKSLHNELWVGYDVELMQYTGLIDKNDIMVYEGDVIHYLENTSQGLVEITVVIKDIRRLPDLSCSKWVEVIGNVHENPELLTKEENDT